MLRPGFKAEAENIARLVRAELNLDTLDALDCFALAETWDPGRFARESYERTGRRTAASGDC